MRNRLQNPVGFLLHSPQGEWIQALVLVTAIAAVTAMASTRLGYAQFDFAVGGAAVLGAALLAWLVLGPSRGIFTVFLLFMIGGHQFRSLFILPFGGVEWHPRELLLFVLWAHLGAKLVFGKADLRPDIMHYFFYVYLAFYVFIAWRGVMRGADMQALVAECRYPIFLSAYFVFVAGVSDLQEFRYYLRLVFWLTLAIAAAGIAFFLYTLISGNVINVQNVWGEYVRRQIGPFLLQSVRPNGHHFFEITIVVLVSLWFCPEERWSRKLFYIPVLALLLFAIAISMMRTSYIGLVLSLGILIVLNLPREIQAVTWYIGAAILAAVFVVFGFRLYEVALQWIPNVETSLRGRFIEIDGAFRMFRREPLMGAGMGSSFQGMGYVAKATLLSVAQADYQTVHNVWMYFLFKGGLVGMLLVSVGLGGIVMRAHRIVSLLPDRRDQALTRGLLAALIGQYVASLAMPRLTYPIGGVTLALVAAAFVVISRECIPIQPKSVSPTPEPVDASESD